MHLTSRLESVCLDGVLGINNRQILALLPLSVAAPGSVLKAEARMPEDRDNLLVFPAEVLVQEPIDDGIEAAVEVSQEVARDKEPFWHLRSHFLWADGHSKADAVQWGPADGEDDKHHEHGEKAPDVTGPQAQPALGLGLPAGLEHQQPDAQVTEGHDSHGEQEVDGHHRHGVLGTGRLVKGTGVDAWVILQGPHEKVGHQGHHGEEPDKADRERGVPVPVDPVVGHAVADVAVAVNGNGSNIEDRADDTQAHHKGTGLAVCLPEGPAVMEDGHED